MSPSMCIDVFTAHQQCLDAWGWHIEEHCRVRQRSADVWVGCKCRLLARLRAGMDSSAPLMRATSVSMRFGSMARCCAAGCHHSRCWHPPHRGSSVQGWHQGWKHLVQLIHSSGGRQHIGELTGIVPCCTRRAPLRAGSHKIKTSELYYNCVYECCADGLQQTLAC